MKPLPALASAFLFCASVLAVTVVEPVTPTQRSDLSQWHNPFANTIPITQPNADTSIGTPWARLVFEPGVTETEREILLAAIGRMNREAGMVLVHPSSKDKKLIPIVIKTERNLTRVIPGVPLTSANLAYGGATSATQSGLYPSGFVDLKKTIFWEFKECLYPAIIHEIGHVLGMDHNGDPSDVMYFVSQSEATLKPEAVTKHLRRMCELAKHQIRLREDPPEQSNDLVPHASRENTGGHSTHEPNRSRQRK